MKKIILTLLVFILPLIANAEAFNQNLYYGMQNDSGVMKLQEFLTTRNIYTGPITGNFYSLTLQAVKVFQELNSISPNSGYFGLKTRTRANEILLGQVGVSNTQATTEKGAISTAKPMQSQIDLLLKQVKLLQDQLMAQQQANTSIQNLQNQVKQQTQVIQQQTQSLSQITQNTAASTQPTILPAEVQITSNQTTQNIFTVEIISPTPGQGIGRRVDPITGLEVGYKAYDWDYLNSTSYISDNERPIGFLFPNESNYIILGAVVRDGSSSVRKDLTCEVTTTDSSQNKILNGTGNVGPIYPNGVKQVVSYYPFSYNFKTTGEHTITFNCSGATKSVTLQVN